MGGDGAAGHRPGPVGDVGDTHQGVADRGERVSGCGLRFDVGDQVGVGRVEWVDLVAAGEHGPLAPQRPEVVDAVPAPCGAHQLEPGRLAHQDRNDVRRQRRNDRRGSRHGRRGRG